MINKKILIKEKIDKEMRRNVLILLLVFLIILILIYSILISLATTNASTRTSLMLNVLFIPSILGYAVYVVINISSRDEYRPLEINEKGIIFPKKLFYGIHERKDFIPIESVKTINFENQKLDWGHQYILTITTTKKRIYRKRLGYFHDKKKITDNNEQILKTIKEKWPHLIKNEG